MRYVLTCSACYWKQKCLFFEAWFDPSSLCYWYWQLSLCLQQNLVGTSQAGCGGAVEQRFLSSPKTHWPCSMDRWPMCPLSEPDVTKLCPNWEEPTKLRQNMGLLPWNAHWWAPDDIDRQAEGTSSNLDARDSRSVVGSSGSEPFISPFSIQLVS